MFFEVYSTKGEDVTINTDEIVLIKDVAGRETQIKLKNGDYLQVTNSYRVLSKKLCSNLNRKK